MRCPQAAIDAQPHILWRHGLVDAGRGVVAPGAEPDVGVRLRGDEAHQADQGDAQARVRAGLDVPLYDGGVDLW